MNQFANHFDNVLRNVEVRIPPQVAEIVDQNLDQARSTYTRSLENLKQVSETVATLAERQNEAAKAIGDKMLQNVTDNTTAGFNVMRALTKAGSVQEAFKIQSEFAQDMSAKMLAQTQEMMGMMSKFGVESASQWSAMLKKD